MYYSQEPCGRPSHTNQICTHPRKVRKKRKCKTELELSLHGKTEYSEQRTFTGQSCLDRRGSTVLPKAQISRVSPVAQYRVARRRPPTLSSSYPTGLWSTQGPVAKHNCVERNGECGIELQVFRPPPPVEPCRCPPLVAVILFPPPTSDGES
jgi:hypothetical protein